MALLLSCCTEKSFGKRAGEARNDFSTVSLDRFRILKVEDCAPSSTKVTCEVIYEIDGNRYESQVTVQLLYEDSNSDPVVFPAEAGQWQILQFSLSEIIQTVNK